MATRSNIGIKTDQGVVYIYCHFDGYFSGVGEALLNSYNSQKRAEYLINLGDMSSIASTETAYHRDRGEDWEDVRPRLEDGAKTTPHEQEYAYMWTNGEGWSACGHDGRWRPLVDILADET